MSKRKAPPPPPPPGPPRVGDWVEISGLAGLARLLELDDKRGRALVQMKDHMLTVPQERMTRAQAPPPPPVSSLVRVQGRSAMQYEIDLHGQRVEEAIELVDRALDQAVVNHLDKFKIIHGHGTGALRKAVRDLLARHPHVENFRFGEPHEGGLACTVAFLRRRN